MTDTVFDLQAKVSADVSPFNQAMDSSATSVSSSLSSIHDAARMFIGTGVVRSFMKATEAAYKFGQSMADISAISDLNIKSLSKSIMQLENVYGRASTVGDTVYEIISSGVQGSERELLNFAKVAGQAAVAIKADLYDTANVITTLTNAYGMSATEVSKIADMLFVAVREGKAHGNELAKTLGLVTNTAAEAGVSLEEMTAVISILSRTQSPSQSMIGFNQMLNGLIKPTQEAAAEAEKWGIEIGATALQTKGLTAILTEMHEKIGGNVEAINKILGNIRAMRAGVSLTGKQFSNFIDVLNQAKAEIGTGVAMEAFSKQTNTARQSLENLKTQADKTFIGIGKDFEPITRWMSEFTEDLLKAFSASGGIGKWSMYIVAGVQAIKATQAATVGLRSIYTKLTDATQRTENSAKTYADHMERAQRAALATTAAMQTVAKATTRATVGGAGVVGTGYIPGRASRIELAQEKVRQAHANVEKISKGGSFIYPQYHTEAVNKAKAEVQNAIKAEHAIVNRYSSGHGADVVPPKFADKRQERLWRLKEHYSDKARTYAASGVDSKTVSQVDSRAQRLETAYTKHIEALNRNVGQANNAVKSTTGVFKTAMGKLRSGFGKLASALYNVTAAIAAIQIGVVIGGAIRKHFKIDDYFNEESRKKEEANRRENMQLMRENSYSLIQRLVEQKKLTIAEASLAASTVSLAKSEAELAKHYTELKNKSKEPVKELTDHQKFLRDMESLQSEFERNKSSLDTKNLGYTFEQKRDASDIIYGNKSRNQAGFTMDLNQMAALKRLLEYQELAAEERGYAKDWEKHGMFPQFKILAARIAGIEDRTYTASAQEEYAEPYTTKLLNLNNKLPEEIATALLRIFENTELTDKQAREAMLQAVSAYTHVRERTGELISLSTTTYEDAKAIASEMTKLFMPVINKLMDVRSRPLSEEQKNAMKELESQRYLASFIAKTTSRITEYYDTQFKGFDFKSTEAYKNRGALPMGVSLAQVELEEVTKHYTSQLDALASFDKEVEQRIQMMKSKGATKEQIEKVRKSFTSQRGLYTQRLEDTKSQRADIEAGYYGKVKDSLNEYGELLQSEGLSEGSATYVRHMQEHIKAEISKLDDLIVSTADERLKETYARLRVDLEQSHSKFGADKYDIRRKDRQARVAAGLLTDTGALRGDIQDLYAQQREGRANISSLYKQRQRYSKGSIDYSFYTNRIAEAQNRLQDTTLKLRESFNKLADSSGRIREGLFGAISDFTKQRMDIQTIHDLGGKWSQRSAGRMDNNALWHSVNLASRMGGAMMRTPAYTIKTSLAPNRQRSMQLRNQAQGAISASVDAFIMSQKYAQANVGKTVTDIYSFMKQNNIIVVRNK